MDRVAAFVSEKTPRRFLAIVAFVGVLYLFQHLALLLIFFVTFERSLAWLSATLAKRATMSRKKALLSVVGSLVVVFGLAAWAGIGKTIRSAAAVEESFPEHLAGLRHNALILKLEEQVGGTEKIVEGIKHYAGDAVGVAEAVGHFFVYVLIGLILAIVFLLEKDEIHEYWEGVDTRSLFGTLGRWLGHVADSVVVTVQLQLVVATFNTVTTLPVLILLGVRHEGPLMLLVFTSALVPVIGNIVSGTVLALLAFQVKGWLGVGIFVALTFILHKIESYYLSPRLTSRHVKMPGFLLIVSLLACEHLFGFKGLFLSFPILFVAGRIRGEFLEEDAVVASASSSIVLGDSPDQLPGHHKQLEEDAGKPTGIELERAHIPLDSVRPGALANADGPDLPPPPALPRAVSSRRVSSSPPPRVDGDVVSKP